MRTAAFRLLALLSLVAFGCQPPAVPPTPPDPPPAPPEPAGPVLHVVATYPGANARTVADTIAAPLLRQIAGVEGLVSSEAVCDDGTCTVVLRFAPKANGHEAVTRVQNRVGLAAPTLPDLVGRSGVTVHRGDPESLPNLWVAVTSPDGRRDVHVLGHVAETQVKDAATRVPGVTGVRAVGSGSQALRVWLDPDKLAARSLTAQDVVNALRQQNLQTAARFKDEPTLPSTLDLVAGVAAAGDIERVVVKTLANGGLVYLRDVAKIELGGGGDGFALVNGSPAALMALTSNGEPATGKALRDALGKIEKLPAGVRVELLADLDSAPEGFAVVELRLPDAASRERTRDVVNRAVKVIRDRPGKPDCLAFGGKESNTATLLVRVGGKDGPSPADIRKVLAKEIQDAVVRVGVPAGGKPFPVRIALTDRGDHGDAKLREWADAVAKRLAQDGIALDPGVFPCGEVPKLSLDIDRTKATALGVSMADVANTLRTFVGGLAVNDFNKFGRTFEVRIEPGATPVKPADLKSLKVKNDKGELVPLGTFVTIRESTAPPAVLRVNLHPALRVTAAVPDGKSAVDVAARCVEIAGAEAKKLGLDDSFKVVNLTP